MPDSSIKQLVEKRFEQFKGADFNSTPYLIMTLFGDSVIPHGGEIWLGSLVQLLQPLGISERRIRTSVFRLTKDTWLESRKIGRKSYYKPCHVGEIERNELRIYYQQEKWDGNWRLLLGVSTEKAKPQRDEFRKILLKNGFCAIATGVFGHPTIAFDEIDRLLKNYQQAHAYIVMSARNPDGSALDFQRVGQVMHRCNMDHLEQEYLAYIKRYQAIFNLRTQANHLNREQCFLLRTLLINDYRHLLWHDVVRSNLLLGEDWAGKHARHIVASIYCCIEEKAREYFCEIGENDAGQLPAMAPRFRERFKHLI